MFLRSGRLLLTGQLYSLSVFLCITFNFPEFKKIFQTFSCRAVASPMLSSVSGVCFSKCYLKEFAESPPFLLEEDIRFVTTSVVNRKVPVDTLGIRHHD